MSSDTDVVQGALKPLGVLENACVESLSDLIKLLPTVLGVEIPASISNVVIGVAQPGDDQRQSLWVRFDTSSDFIGLYVYAQGKWRQIYPVPKQVFEVFGNSSLPDTFPGYTLATEYSGFTTSQKDYYAKKSHWNNDVPNTYWDVFYVVYTGY